MKHFQSASDSAPSRDRIVVEVDILKDKLGCLIGTGGSNLKSIVASCNNAAQINVPDRQRMLDAAPSQSKFATVTVTGTVTGVFHAVREIQTYCEVALAEAHIKTRLDPVYTLAFLQSDNDRIDALYNIRTQHDVKLRLDRRDGYIAVEGAPSDVEASVAKISKLLPDTSAPPARGSKPSNSRSSASGTSSNDRPVSDRSERPKTAPTASSSAASTAARAAKAQDSAAQPKHEAGSKQPGKGRGGQPGVEGKMNKAAKEPKQHSADAIAASTLPVSAAVTEGSGSAASALVAPAAVGDAVVKKKRGGRGKKKLVPGEVEGAGAAGGSAED